MQFRPGFTAAGQTNLLAEYTIHNLSDADFTFSIPAVTGVAVLLANLAPRFGYDPADTARFNNRFRNVVLSQVSAERLLVLYANGGLPSVAAEIERSGTAGCSEVAEDRLGYLVPGTARVWVARGRC
jgi:hypothetical protein